MLLATFVGLVAPCDIVLVLNKLRSGTRDDPDVRDLNANLHSIARELTFGLAGR